MVLGRLVSVSNDLASLIEPPATAPVRRLVPLVLAIVNADLSSFCHVRFHAACTLQQNHSESELPNNIIHGTIHILSTATEHIDNRRKRQIGTSTYDLLVNAAPSRRPGRDRYNAPTKHGWWHIEAVDTKGPKSLDCDTGVCLLVPA